MGYWKKQREMKGVEAEWDIYSGKYKLYTSYTREMSGDDIGVWFDYDTDEGGYRGEDGYLVREHRERPPEHEYGAARLRFRQGPYGG